VVSVVTNIDADHMETYGHDFGRLKQAFVDFLHRLPFYGVAVVCGDDANVREIIPRVAKQIVTYGIDSEVNFRAENVVAEGGTMRFTCVRTNGNVSRLPITLNLPGCHNVLNALAAIAVATEVGVGDTAIVKALADFRGVGRRFQRYGEIRLSGRGNISPWSTTTAIIRSRWRRRWRRRAAPSPAGSLVLAFQPHRFTREPATASRTSSRCLVRGGRPDARPRSMPPARRRLSPPTARTLVRASAHRRQGSNRYSWKTSQSCPQPSSAATRDGDVVITMGAGSIGGVPGTVESSGGP
jgi:UDP-N-acetylmuramate--alanine ligase